MSPITAIPQGPTPLTRRMMEDAKLRSLNLRRGNLITAVREGAVQRGGVATASDMPGSHAEIFEAVERTSAGFYVRRNKSSFVWLESEDKKNRIVVAAGNQYTGLLESPSPPVNTQEKGIHMEWLAEQSGVQINGRGVQLSFTPTTLHVLLYYILPDESEWRAELSIPSELNDGFFEQWKEPRIIIEDEERQQTSAPTPETHPGPRDESTQWTDSPEIDLEDADSHSPNPS